MFSGGAKFLQASALGIALAAAAGAVSAGPLYALELEFGDVQVSSRRAMSKRLCLTSRRLAQHCPGTPKFNITSPSRCTAPGAPQMRVPCWKSC